MPNIKGEGSVSYTHVDAQGRVVLGTMGRDRRSGDWAAYEAIIPWSVWETMNESVYNEREDQAQQRIPGT